jgi:hypothetical protein
LGFILSLSTSRVERARSEAARKQLYMFMVQTLTSRICRTHLQDKHKGDVSHLYYAIKTEASSITTVQLWFKVDHTQSQGCSIKTVQAQMEGS